MNGAADVPVAPTAALHRPDDQRLSDSIRTALQSNHRVAGLAIHVAAQGGVVVLSGVVRSDAEKELAGRIAQRNASGIEVRNALAVARHRPRGLRVAGIDVAVA